MENIHREILFSKLDEMYYYLIAVEVCTISEGFRRRRTVLDGNGFRHSNLCLSTVATDVKI